MQCFLYFRFKCGICADESVTYRYMYSHVKGHNPDKCWENIICLPSKPHLETWLQMLIHHQTSKIVKHLSPSSEVGEQVGMTQQCHHCNKR